jgi:hypothetical protein
MQQEDKGFSPGGCDVSGAKLRGWRTPPRLAALLAAQQQAPNIAVNDNQRKRPRASGQIEKVETWQSLHLAAAPSATSRWTCEIPFSSHSCAQSPDRVGAGCCSGAGVAAAGMLRDSTGEQTASTHHSAWTPLASSSHELLICYLAVDCAL